MARKSWVARQEHKHKVVEKYATKCAELKAMGDYLGLPKRSRAKTLYPDRSLNTHQ